MNITVNRELNVFQGENEIQHTYQINVDFDLSDLEIPNMSGVVQAVNQIISELDPRLLAE